MKEKLKTVLFTVAVTAIFTILVSGVNAVLADRIAANKLVARQFVVIDLFGLASETVNLTDAQIPGYFDEKIVADPAFKDSGIESYRLKGSTGGLVVCSFFGQGFWDNINGFIAIDLADRKIKGIEFTMHGETPGLGGRISEPEFKARFIDKPFEPVRSDGLRLKVVSEGTAKKTDEVDGITGATGTSSAIEKIINNSINKILSISEGRAAQ